MSTVQRLLLAAPTPDRVQTLHYLRTATPTPELDALIDSVQAELFPLLEYKVCHCRLPIKKEGQTLHIGILRTDSAALAKALAGCEEALIFAATVGLSPDRLLKKYAHRSPARALCVQAVATERIEALCDAFCRLQDDTLREKGQMRGMRFSPGYGDLALSVQKEVFQMLDCPRQIGLSLNESLLMSPTKSVTAIVGIRQIEA